ncbi:MAG: KEOPS complex subunit Pcc1 [Candidatus Nitrosocaldaceae archaeon]
MQQIKVKVRLDLPYDLSNTITKALAADNINFPDGLSMDMMIDESLNIVFKCNDINKIKSMINTIDETLEHISMILDMLGEKNARS